MDLAFRDESADVARKVALKADPAPAASSSTAEGGTGSDRLSALLRWQAEASTIFAAQKVHLVPTLDDQATAFYFAHYLIPGADPARPTRGPSELDATIQASIRAVGVAGLLRPAFASGGLNAETAKRYVAAIRQTNVALRDADQVRKDSTLLATMMLGVFETMTGRTPSSLTAWISHIDGVAALVKLRGSEQLETWAGRRLFMQATTYLMNDCLQRSLPLPEDIMVLTAELGTHMHRTDRIWCFHLAACDVVNFRARVRQDLFPDRIERLANALELDRRLMQVFSDLPLGWRYQTFKTERDRDLVLTGCYHVYPNFFVVQLWNGARLMRMMLNEIMYDDLVAGFAASPPLFQGDLYHTQLRRTAEALSQLQVDMIASVPQHLGYTPRSSTTSSSSSSMFFSRSRSPPTTEHKFLWSSLASFRYLPSADSSFTSSQAPSPSPSHSEPDNQQQPTIRILGGYQILGVLFYLGRTPRDRSSSSLRRWVIRVFRALGTPNGWAIGQAIAFAKKLEKLWEEEAEEEEAEEEEAEEEEEEAEEQERREEEGEEEEEEDKEEQGKGKGKKRELEV